MENYGTYLLEKGKSYHDFGKTATKWGYIIAACSFFLLLCCNEFEVGVCFETLVYIDWYTDGAVFFAVVFELAFVFAFWGTIFYFVGLHYLGLGQIAINTEKLSSSNPTHAEPSNAIVEELPEL